MVDKKLFAKNSFSGLIQKIIIAIITFLAIPIFIHTKGKEIYGIFATISVLGELSRLTELGFTKTLIKFLSIQGRTKESSQDILIATIVVLCILVPVTCFLFVADNFVLLSILRIPLNQIEQSREFYYYAVAANSLLLMGSLYSSVIESQRYIYKINILQLVYSLLYWCLIILVLLLGYDLRAIGLVIFASALIWFVLTIGMMRYIWGPFHLSGFGKYFKTSFKKLTNYSLKIYLSSILAFFEEPLIKILVSNFFGVTYVGYLDIGIRIKSQIYRLLQTLIYPLFQLFSEIQDKVKLRFILKDIQEKLFIITAPLCIILITCTGSFIHLWLRNSDSTIIWTAIIITSGALLFQFTIMPTIYFLTIYHPTTLIFTQVIIILVNAVTVYVGHFFIGYYSVYLSFILFYITQALLRLYYQKKYLNCSLFTDKKLLRNFIVSLLILSLMGGGLNISLNHSNLLNILISPIVLGLATLFLFKFLNIITKEDILKYFGNYDNRIIRLLTR
jgi:O-antigen/teichoic acid export membrane protein